MCSTEWYLPFFRPTVLIPNRYLQFTNDEKNSDINSKLSEQLMKGLTKSLYASGVFDDDDIKDRKSLASAMKRVLDNGGIDGIVTDHTNSLLTVARN